MVIYNLISNYGGIHFSVMMRNPSTTVYGGISIHLKIENLKLGKKRTNVFLSYQSQIWMLIDIIIATTDFPSI